MTKDMVVTLEDNDKYYLMEEIIYNGNKYFIADELDENNNRINDLCVFKELHNGEQIYLEIEENEEIIAQIKAQFI